MELFNVFLPNCNLFSTELDQMGTNTSNCMGSTPKDDEFLQNEMKIYRWRSDARSNAFLPRVSFRNGSLARKQQKFSQFLQQAIHQNYIDLEQYRQQERNSEREGEGDILIFQKYRGTLEEVNDILTLPEAAFTLSSLVAAFASLKKIFKEVIVCRSCWFVTKTGQVRAWINPDPKCNFIQQSGVQQIFDERNYKGVASKIIDEVYKCCEKSASINCFFGFLRETVDRTELRSDLFQLMRQKISHYCGFNRVPNCSSIEDALKKKNLQEKQQRSFSVVKPSDAFSKLKNESLLNETRITGYTADNQRSNYQNKSKSVQSSSGISHAVKNVLPNSSLLEPNQSVLYSNSQFCRQSNSNFARILQNSTNFVSASPGSKIIKVSQIMEKTEKPKPILKLSQCPMDKSQLLAIKLSTTEKNKTPTDSLKISLDAEILISQNILTENEVSQKITEKKEAKQARQSNRVSKLSRNSKPRNFERKISILEQFEEDQEVKHPHPKTFHEVNSCNSFKECEYANMPWRTNKTITKLINDETDSLVHSIGSSSDEYNGSLYSGVLTHMGRDITQKIISSHNSRSDE